MLFFLLSCTAQNTPEPAAVPTDSADAHAWFAGACSESLPVPVHAAIAPLTLDRAASSPEPSVNLQMSSTSMFLDGVPHTPETLADGLQEKIDVAHALGEDHPGRLLLVLSGDVSGEALAETLRIAAQTAHPKVAFFFYARPASAPPRPDEAYASALTAALDPLDASARQALLAEHTTSLVAACPDLEPIIASLAVSVSSARCALMEAGLPPALQACNKPAVSRRLYTLLSVVADDRPFAAVEITLEAGGELLRVDKGSTWEAIHPQVLAHEGRIVRVE